MIRQLSVFLENKGGRLRGVCETLKNAEIDIRAMSIADTTDFGIVRLIVSDPEKAAEALRLQNFTARITNVAAFSIEDKPGALYEVMELLGEINIEYSYSFMGGRSKEADIVIKTADHVYAEELLVKNNITLVTEADIK